MNEKKSLPTGAIIGVAVVVVAILGFLVYRFNQPEGGSGGGSAASYNPKDYEAKQKQLEQERTQQQQSSGQTQGGRR
jgi:hypothetical protein